jgi:hypothetical protein
MAGRDIGLTEKSTLRKNIRHQGKQKRSKSQKLKRGKPIIGYTDHSTVKLDFDDMPFREVKYWAIRAMNWFKLEGFIILKSSKNHYHMLFNRPVTWEKNLKIIDWVAILTKNPKVKDYCLMQGIKQSSTLRISTKKNKPSPRIVFHYGKQDKEISEYLHYCRMFKKNLRIIL